MSSRSQPLPPGFHLLRGHEIYWHKSRVSVHLYRFSRSSFARPVQSQHQPLLDHFSLPLAHSLSEIPPLTRPLPFPPNHQLSLDTSLVNRDQSVRCTARMARCRLGQLRRLINLLQAHHLPPTEVGQTRTHAESRYYRPKKQLTREVKVHHPGWGYCTGTCGSRTVSTDSNHFATWRAIAP